ncbi:MAG: helix-turn-helix domain-containing protein [Burkholderiaceae bacterium]
MNNNESESSSLDTVVKTNLESYLSDLNGSNPQRIYDMVISAVERPMLEVVMRHAENNQVRASEMLGINRNTLRKKLQSHGIHRMIRN